MLNDGHFAFASNCPIPAVLLNPRFPWHRENNTFSDVRGAENSTERSGRNAFKAFKMAKEVPLPYMNGGSPTALFLPFTTGYRKTLSLTAIVDDATAFKILSEDGTRLIATNVLQNGNASHLQ